jgi:hypothetical protein
MIDTTAIRKQESESKGLQICTEEDVLIDNP